ncbi:MAG: TonB-dependent receptor [Ignavibacteriaceae bacterium]|nr:TonB-dependent receptor [Ignavibacteriaceae bacterium]
MMKKVLFCFSFLFCVSIYSQDLGGRVDYDLPQFVITGKRTFQFPVLKKLDSELVNTLGPEFLRPPLPKYNLTFAHLRDPQRPVADFEPKLEFVSGSFTLTSGNLFLPKADLDFTIPLRGAMINFGAKGFLRRDYLPNADESFFTGFTGFKFFTDTESEFLPGAEIFGKIDYTRSTYRLFESTTPELQQQLSTGNTELGLKSSASDVYQVGLSLKGEITDLAGTVFSEQILRVNAFANFQIEFIEVQSEVKFSQVSLDNQNEKGLASSRLSLTGLGGFNISRFAKVYGGIEYITNDNDAVLKPQARFSMKFFNGIYIIASYSPSVIIMSNRDLLKQNRYFNENFLQNYYYKEDHALNGSIKFESQDLWEVKGGLKFFNSTNYYYFVQDGTTGKFNVAPADVTSFSSYGSFVIFPGYLGRFYGEAKYNHLRDSDGKQIPFVPSLEVFAGYGTAITNEIDINAKLTLTSGTYTDIANTNSIDPFFNVEFDATYRLNRNVEIKVIAENLINQEFPAWGLYRNPGFSIQAGASIKW